MYNKDSADTAENNVCFDKPWSEVTEDDIKVFAPGKKQQWTTADELVIELTLVLNGVFDNIEQTNIGPWTDIYTIAEFVHRLEKHVEAMD